MEKLGGEGGWSGQSLGGGQSRQDSGEVWLLPVKPSPCSERHVAGTCHLQLVEGSPFPG